MIEYNHIHPSYIFNITQKEINSVLFDLGTKYDRASEDVTCSKIISERYSLDDKPITNAILYFLIDAHLLDNCDHYLAERGKSYFEALFIHKDTDFADSIIRQGIQHNPIVNLIGQVFYGRGKIGNDQLQILLNYHNVASWEIDAKDIVSLLSLLNKYGIAVYDKKNRAFYIKEPMAFEDLIKQYYISPSTPFSNIYNIRKVLRSCLGNILWIDKHFRKEGFEIIVDGLAYEGVKSFTIISSLDNVTESAKSDYKDLKQELFERKINLSWSIINDTSFKWHDRWIVSDNCCYNVPPVLAIIRGQRSDILKTDSVLDINPFIKASISLEAL